MNIKPNIFILVFVTLVILPFITASYDECMGIITEDNIPCTVLLRADNCNSIVAQVYNVTTNLNNYTLSDYNSIYCNFTFVYTNVGTYTYNFSNGDTGSIIVEEGNKMIYLIYFVAALIVILIIAGIYLQDATFLAVGGLCLMAFGVYIFANGFNGLSNLLTQIISIIGVALGFYVMLRSIFENTDLKYL